MGELRVQGAGCMLKAVGYSAQCSGFRVWAARCRVWGAGFGGKGLNTRGCEAWVQDCCCFQQVIAIEQVILRQEEVTAKCAPKSPPDRPYRGTSLIRNRHPP